MEATAIVTAIGIGTTLLVAMVGGFWGVMKLIGARFETVDKKLDDMKEKNASTIAQLQVNEAIQATRLDSLEGMVKLFPQMFQQQRSDNSGT